VTVPLSGRREDDFEHIDAVARNGAGLLACEPPGTYILAHSRHIRGTTGICAQRTARIDVKRSSEMAAVYGTVGKAAVRNRAIGRDASRYLRTACAVPACSHP